MFPFCGGLDVLVGLGYCANDGMFAESRAMGQPMSLAKRMILGPAATWRYYAGFAGKVAGESFPPDEDGLYKIVQYEPLGKLIGLGTGG